MTEMSLRARRKRLGKSLVSMKELTGIDISTLSRIERDKVDPKRSTINRYDSALRKLEREQGFPISGEAA